MAEILSTARLSLAFLGVITDDCGKVSWIPGGAIAWGFWHLAKIKTLLSCYLSACYDL